MWQLSSSYPTPTISVCADSSCFQQIHTSRISQASSSEPARPRDYQPYRSLQLLYNIPTLFPVPAHFYQPPSSPTPNPPHRLNSPFLCQQLYIPMFTSKYLDVNASNMGYSRLAQRSKQKDYLTKDRIGSGTFGDVEKCESKEDGKIYAVKTIMVNRMYLNQIEQEAKNMRMLNSQYILQLCDSFYDEELGSYVLVTPYYKHGSFQQLMSKDWELDQLILFFYQMAIAHAELYHHNICHLDLKPQNILLQSENQYILCDLGCSRKLEQQAGMAMSFNALKVSTNVRGGGTTQYGSPDLVINGEMTDFSDIWSLGVILYKIIYQKHPLMNMPNAYMNKLNQFLIGKVDIQYPDNERAKKFWPILPILKRMLVCSRDKSMRIKWSEILDKIYQIVKIPKAQQNSIITNYNYLLSFTDNTLILLSALLHYLDILADCLKDLQVDLKSLSRDICLYLLSITKETVTHTNDLHQDFWQFYMFEVTRRNLTLKQKSYSKQLQLQALKFASKRSVNVEYVNVKVYREMLLVACGKLYKSLKAAVEPSEVDKKVALKRAIEIANFVAFDNKLEYREKRGLDEMVCKLINH